MAGMTPGFGGKKLKIEIDSSIWRETLLKLNSSPRFGGKLTSERVSSLITTITIQHHHSPSPITITKAQ
jgi:hypothetical protein